MSSPLDYLGTPDASTTIKGKVRLATTAETTTGTATNIACTPAGVAAVAIAGSPDASTTTKGIIEIATDSEAVAKTSGSLALVPSNIPNIMAEPGDIGGTTPGAGTFTTLTASTLVFSSALDVSEGGTGLSSITDHGIMVGSGTGAVTPLAVGTNNQILIGQTGADPAWTTNVDLPGTLDVTGAATLDDALSVAGAATVSGLLTGEASATISTAGATLDLASDNSGDDVILGGGTTARAITIGQDAAAHTVAIGQAAAGAITIDTAAGVSIDAATASNFTVTGASADLTLASAGGSVNITSTENAANAIFIEADGGISETIQIHSDQGTGVASIYLLSDVGGVTVSSGLASDDAINLTASAGGIDIDGAMQVNIASSENTADSIVINSSAGGIDITAAGAAGEDIDITCSAGSVNITGGESASDAVVISASDASGGVTIDSGSAGVNVTGDLSLAAVATKLSYNGGAATDFIGTGTLSSGVLAIANTNIAATDRIFIQRTGINGSSALGMYTYSINAGVSFTVTSVQPGTPASTETNDDSTFTYVIIGQD